MMKSARQFCDEYRPLLASVFKRSGGVGLMGSEMRGGMDSNVRELADVLMLLITTCGWMEEGRDAKPVYSASRYLT